MKSHYHHDFIGALILSWEVALIFHAHRFLAARLAKTGSGQRVGSAIGSAFTFGGM